eukprot:5019335-Pleurochrysis_carterae.AAC.4
MQRRPPASVRTLSHMMHRRRCQASKMQSVVCINVRDQMSRSVLKPNERQCNRQQSILKPKRKAVPPSVAARSEHFSPRSRRFFLPLELDVLRLHSTRCLRVEAWPYGYRNCLLHRSRKSFLQGRSPRGGG